MNTQTITLPLPTPLLAALRSLADDREDTLDRLVRGRLDREVMRLRSAQAGQRLRAERIARLRSLLAPVIAAAAGWADLQARLALFGFELRPAGGGLTLHDAGGARLCKSSELWFACSRLVRNFGAPMPGHPHRMQHLLTKKAAGVTPDDPLELFEPF
ncbi:MAG: hypothetical protein AUK37_05240 [Rhodobacterales bacterium CG2_30_65_12]|nr:MAG: hypothetical protein AUK37_05240 [Rhodobacterales bacterium CG2_30_65_12]